MRLSCFKSWTVCLSWVAVLLLSDASNGDILDQSSPAGDLSFFVNEISDQAQTFTVGVTGQLTMFDLYIGRAAATTDDLLIDIRQVTGAGAPTEPNAGSNVVVAVTATAASVSTTAGWKNFDISSFNIPVVAGQQYAIALRSASSEPVAYDWIAKKDDPLAGGSSFQRLVTTSAPWQDAPFSKDVDLAFRTYVAIPEPSSALVLFSLGTLACRRKRAC